MLESSKGRKLPLRGSKAGNIEYAQSLKNRVSIDWKFNPKQQFGQLPVRRADGRPFSVLWRAPSFGHGLPLA